MSRLPLLLSVPHAGLDVPPEVASLCLLTPDEIARDGDEQAAEIYDLATEAETFVTTSVARAIIDLNRAETDRQRDGVVKTHTCWMVPVYENVLPESIVQDLLDKYYRPYHQRLTDTAAGSDLLLAVDCHTMSAVGPPIGPDAGVERPWVCLSNADGTCPGEWIELMKECFGELIDGPVRINDPFRGGYITRTHSTEMPWLQLEMSREPFLTPREKRSLVRDVLRMWTERAAGGVR